MNLDLKFKDVLKQTNEQQTLEKSRAIFMLLLNIKKRASPDYITAHICLSVCASEREGDVEWASTYRHSLCRPYSYL